jgi:hypothetical protein
MENDIGGMLGMAGSLVTLAIMLVLIVANWKLFTKANQPGWACLIPVYNIYVWTQIVGRPAWWIILLFIPIVNFIVAIILCIDMAKSFGKDALYGFGIAILGIIFLPMLAYGSATYQGPSAAA